ncbi:hypothetical protein KIN20_018094 [Parelaphostrongylus tenuis]|uniref:glucuronosyltransferase n=1 Tax=Parelaphostrongylus tenuis TaxID=148309 RepID=A0AAD5N739_PARTN|nr:hypothetical protein KIN20_018094 [Parelaphostrongylus tenuis]
MERAVEWALEKEAIIAGVPLVTVALFDDQPRNAKLAAKHRIAVNLRKNNLTVDAVIDALQKIFDDQSYRMIAKSLSEMLCLAENA